MLRMNLLLGKCFVLANMLLVCLGGFAQGPQANKPSAQTQAPAAQPEQVSYPSGTQVNYVRTWEAKGPVTDPNQMLILPYTEVQQTTQYLDGLGRPLQTVVRQASPGSSPKDLVAPVFYDPFGREVYKYLPYISPGADGAYKQNPFSEQASFMQGQYPGEQVYYSKTEFEPSPLNRVEKTFAPGNSWAGSAGTSSEKAVRLQYLVNTQAEGVRTWAIGFDDLTYDGAKELVNPNVPESPLGTVYGDGQLYKNVTLDESGNAVVEYRDKEGRVVLKKVQVEEVVPEDYSGHDGFLCTYYVYDDLGQLRFVLPPKAVAAINTDWNLSPDVHPEVVSELCFRYEYDARGRLTHKKVPGAGWVYLVYDKRDRLVFTQDANMRGKAQWLATVYDALNRPVATGMISYAEDWQALQNHVNGVTGSSTPGSIESTSPITFDLYTANREAGRELYQARNSIEFLPGFSTEAEAEAEFTAEITSGTPATESIAVLDNPLTPAMNFVPLTLTYYDDYTWTNKTFDASFNQYLSAGSNPHAEGTLTPAQVGAVGTRGMVTGTKVRVLEDPNDLGKGVFLASVSFYDPKGRVVQVQSEHYRGGTDITTHLYDFTGKVLSSYLKHNNPASGIASVGTLTEMSYDHSGRLLESYKTVGGLPRVRISKNDYDALGQLSKKELGQQKTTATTYNTEPVTSLEYTYNIRGWLQGINKGYANGSPSASEGYFGLELHYDWGFDSKQFNGNIAGVKWRSRGDGVQRAYGFSYDRVNRLLGGDFSEGSGSSYLDNAAINFDMVMGDGVSGSSAYDENGNIKKMKQWGLKIAGSDVIDDLVYTYRFNGSGNTNKLLNVIDGANLADTRLGDFRTSTLHPTQNKTTTTLDYSYDGNGNLKKDLNKDIGDLGTDGIEYNHLNLPYRIKVKAASGEKGTITYVYDAAGTKLEKRVREGASSTTNQQAVNKTTTYLGAFVYENNELQFLAHEEGRFRFNNAASPPEGAPLHSDYFIKDHLGNVRMVLTDEEKVDKYPIATLEDSKLTIEEGYYAINREHIVVKTSVGGLTEAANTYTNGSNTFGNNPPDANFENNTTSEKVYKLNKNTAKTGLGITLKVMAGDRIDLKAKSYYNQNNPTNGTDPNATIPLTEILSGLIGGPGGVVASAREGVTVGTINTPNNTEQITSGLFTDQTSDFNQSTSVPKAYINYIFFDEQFKSVASGFSRVGTNGQVYNHSLLNIPAPKNGYVYIYCSNESPVNVFFDNVQVVHTRGAILEETHYYPFGLTMAGISSKAAGGVDNRKKFNGGTEFTTDLDLSWYETSWRGYDPQLGRFHQIDMMAHTTPDYSPYTFVQNNPILFFDPLGLDTVRVNGEGSHKIKVGQGDVLAWTIGETTSYYTYDPSNKDAVGGFVGAGMDGGTMENITVSATSKPRQSADYSTLASWQMAVGYTGAWV